MAETDVLTQKRDDFVNIMRNSFNPLVIDASEAHEAAEFPELRDLYLNSTEDDYDNYDEALLDEVTDALRLVTTGRAKLSALYNSHRFEEAVTATESNTSDDDLVAAIYHWNPPSVKTASRFSNEYGEVADVLEAGAKLVTESEESEVGPELKKKLNRAAESAAVISDRIGQMREMRDKVRKAKSEYLTATGRRKRAARTKSATQNVLTEAFAPIENLPDQSNYVFAPSKQKLPDAVKDWNVAGRELRAEVNEIAETSRKIISAVEAQSGDTAIDDDTRKQIEAVSTHINTVLDEFGDWETRLGQPVSELEQDSQTQFNAFKSALEALSSVKDNVDKALKDQADAEARNAAEAEAEAEAASEGAE